MVQSLIRKNLQCREGRLVRERAKRRLESKENLNNDIVCGKKTSRGTAK